MVFFLAGRACAAIVGGGAGDVISTALPSGLTPGSCRVFAPLGPDRGRTVFIDPGHGGPDPGVVGVTPDGRRVEEKTVALDVALDLTAHLRRDGYRVVLSRTRDSTVATFGPGDPPATSADGIHRDLLARIACANASRATVLVSVHCNGFDDPSVGGTETVYDGARPFSARSLRLARDLQRAMVARLGLADRGVVPDDQLDAYTLSDRADSYGHLLLLGPAQSGYVDHPSRMPGVLVEPLFLTAPAEAELAGSGSGQERIARALAAGLEADLGGGAS
ncbi:MAG TPA: N-acetylmuramoyl-L-alanine amidase [Candidatus Dormibacteraeota bacterium]|nr:N-acetylmuramoyl-L-alanine amidase [Candidatus Dormibacteraeota bacterium]